MSTFTLSLHDAKNRFSAVVEAAQRGEPQLVTKRGVPAVVVISAEEYERLRQCVSKDMPSFRDHLLAMPTDDVEFETLNASLREFE